MNNRLLALVISFIFISRAASQSTIDCRLEALKLIGVIEKYHIAPPVMDTFFSAKVFDMFLYELDPDKVFFTSDDFKSLSAYKYSLISRLNDKSWDFTEIIKRIYTQRLKQYDSLLYLLSKVPFDLQKKETLKKRSVQFLQSKQKEEFIRKRLKYALLMKMFAGNDSSPSLPDLSKEPIIRERLLKSEVKITQKLLASESNMDNFIFSSFLNSIALCADPHSEYMTNREKQSFETTLKPESMSFGFQVTLNSDNEMVVVSLTPGGPAWNSNAIRKGDVIVAFILPGKPKTYIADLDFDEANEIISSPENKTIEFIFRRTDGTVKSVKLQKASIEQEENVIKSYVLNGSIKVGYISLPDFYSQYENATQLGCANDIAKECIKLQKENVAGLIIDLRDNGGGSVKEAIDLAGLFVNYGPICILREAGGKSRVVKDFNRGTAYNGPLLLLINNQSASASEIFASAMQEYNRALIVGSRSFGKATAQAFVPTDTNIVDNKANGFVKLTFEKIYRINGKSNQKVGIKPDVELPDIMESFNISESNEQYALANDSVKASVYSPAGNIPISLLKAKSLQRVGSNLSFQTIKQLSDSLSGLNDDNNEVPLDLKGFSAYYSNKKELFLRLEKKLYNHNSNFSVETIKFDGTLAPIKSDFDKQFSEIIKNDIYIQESFSIFNDWNSIQQTSKP